MTIQDWFGDNNTLGIDIWEKKYRRDMQYRILDMMKQRNDAIEQYTMKTDLITQQFNEIKELLNQVLKK